MEKNRAENPFTSYFSEEEVSCANSKVAFGRCSTSNRNDNKGKCDGKNFLPRRLCENFQIFNGLNFRL